MTNAEKRECLENLKLLGVFDSGCFLATCGKSNYGEEFSFDVPNFRAFPVILHHLFGILDEHERSRRFKDCWPIYTKADTTKFRQASISWLQEIKKAEPAGTMSDFSSFLFDNPFGDRYVRFLVGFSTYVLRNACLVNESSFSSNDNNDRATLSSSTESFSSGASGTSVTAKELRDVEGYVTAEGKMMDKFRTEANSDINSFTQHLLEEKELEQRECGKLCEIVANVSLRLRCNQETEVNEQNVKPFTRRVVAKSKAKLERYRLVWDRILALKERRERFDTAFKLASEERVTLKGIDSAKRTTASNSTMDDVFRGGRLDVLKLVKTLRSSVRTVQENAVKVGDALDLKTINENSIKTANALTLLVQEQKQLGIPLKWLLSDTKQSTQALRKKVTPIAMFQQPRPAVWMRLPPLYQLKSLPMPSFDELSNVDLDWSKICSSDYDFDSTTCVRGLSAPVKCSNDASKNGTGGYVTREQCSDVSDSHITSIPQRSEHDNNLSTSVWTLSGTQDEETKKCKPPKTGRKFRLSLSPFSSSISSLGISSINESHTTCSGTIRKWNETGVSGFETFGDGSPSYSAGNWESTYDETLDSKRRVSVRIQGDLLKAYRMTTTTTTRNSGWASETQWPGNPFVHYITMDAKYKVRVILMSIFVVPVRLVLMSAAILIAYILSLITLANSKDFHLEPLRGWRKKGKDLVIKFFLLAHFVCGFYRVKVKGKKADPWEAPILVIAPHSSLLDALPVAAIGAPSFVGKVGLMKIPVISTILMITQPIFVDRDSKDSRKSAVEKIRERARLLIENKDHPDGVGWPQIAMFPEATTTNRSQLIDFKAGAFLPQLPVQPVCLRWPNTPDTITWPWEGVSCFQSFWLSLCQFENHLEIEFLPVYVPNDAEKNDAMLFARNVRAVMAQALNLPVSVYSWEDAKYLTQGYNPDRNDFMNLSDDLDLPYAICDDTALENVWSQLKRSQWSELAYQATYEQFIQEYLKTTDCPKLQRLFNMFDWTCMGVIDLREFIIAAYANVYSYNSMKLCFEMFREKYTGNISQESFVRILRIPYGVSVKRCKKIHSILMSDSGSGKLLTVDALRNLALKHNEFSSLCRIENNNNR